ncbi:MAG: ABC transporter permease [Acidaminococcaceae bacterium]|jgi:ABC-2 type transport system permease protein|nr:ABC transporter permease [Acidaminococcaceae bacterium]
MLARILALLKKEFITTFNNTQSKVVILLPPIIMLFMFGYAVTMEVKNIQMGVWDKSQTVESRDLISCFQNSRWYRDIFYYEDMPTLEEAMADQDIDCALIINENFSRNIRQGSPADVHLILDGRQVNTSAIISGYSALIVNGYIEQLTGSSLPIDIAVRNWFNPNLDYKWTILATVFTVLSTLSCLLLTSMSVSREKEMGTFEQLTVSPLQPFEILIGKTLPPFFISVTMSIFMLILMSVVFGLPFRGSLGLLMVAVGVALLALSGIGLFISSLCRTQQQSLLGVFAYEMPAILLSGFISPVEDMPYIFQAIDVVNPMKYYVIIAKGLFLKQMSAATVYANVWPMAAIAVITLTLAAVMFRRKME